MYLYGIFGTVSLGLLIIGNLILYITE